MRSISHHVSFDIAREIHTGVLQPRALDEEGLTVITVGNMATRRLSQLVNQYSGDHLETHIPPDNPALSVIHADEIAATVACHAYENPELNTANDVWHNLRRVTHSYGDHAYSLEPTAFNTVALRKGEDGSINLALQPDRKSQDPAVVAIREERAHFLNVIRNVFGYVPSEVERSDIGYHIGTLPPEMGRQTQEHIRSILGYIVCLELFQSDRDPTPLLASKSGLNISSKSFTFESKPKAHHSAFTLTGEEAIMARASIQPAPTTPIKRTIVNGTEVPAVDHDNHYYETMHSALAGYVKKCGSGKSPAQLAEQVAWLSKYQEPEPDLPPQRQTSPTGNELPIGHNFDHLSSTSR